MDTVNDNKDKEYVPYGRDSSPGFPSYKYSPQDGPLIRSVSAILVEVMIRIYRVCKPTTDISGLDLNQLANWIIDKYEKRYERDYGLLIPVDQISFRLPVPNKQILSYESPFDLKKISRDMDDATCNDYGDSNNTIIYNNDMFNVALSIYVVPFDSLDVSLYEIYSTIEALSSLEN